ncbi:MAG: hypothetical protein GXY51_02505 [Bacteroidetes bacterium]|nr:hypothetical protein [Bacteroidota bacterium]
MGLFDFALKEKKEEEKEQLGSGFGGGWGLSDLVNEKKKKELSPNVTSNIGAGAGSKTEGNTGKFDFALKIPDVETIKQKEQALAKAEETFSTLDQSIETNYKRYQELGQQLDDLEVELQEAPEELKWNLSIKYEKLRTEHNKLVDQLKTETEQQKKVYKEYNTIRDNYEKDIQRYNKKAEAQNKLAQEQHQDYLDTSRLQGSMKPGEELPKTREQELKEKFTSTDDASYWGGTSQDPERLADTPFGTLAKAIGTQRAVEKIYPEETKALKEFRADVYTEASEQGKKQVNSYDIIATIQSKLTGKPADEIRKGMKPTNTLTSFVKKNPELTEAVNLYQALDSVEPENAFMDAMETITWSGMLAMLGGQSISLLYKTAPKVMDAIKTKTNIATPEQFREIMSKATSVNPDPKAVKAFKEITAELNKAGLKPIDVIRGKMNVTYTTPRFAMEGGKLYGGLPADEIAKMIVETGKVTADVVKGLDPVQVSKVTQQLLNTAPALASEFLKAVEKPITETEKAEVAEKKLEDKELWEVTKDEISQLKFKDLKGNKTPFLTEEQHKIAIQKALKEGKPVPEEVLKDYPDLRKEPTGVEAKREAIAKEEVSLPQKAPEPPISEGEKGELIDNTLKKNLKPIINIEGGRWEGKNQGRYVTTDGDILSVRKIGGGVVGPHDTELERMGIDVKDAASTGILRLRPNVEGGEKKLYIESKIIPNQKQISSLEETYPDYRIIFEITKQGEGYNANPNKTIEVDYGEDLGKVIRGQLATKPTTSQSSEAPRVPQKETQKVISEVTKAPEEQLATPEQVQEVKTLGKDRKLIIKTKQGNISDNRFKRLAKAMTGKTNPEKMTPDEIEEFKYAIEQVVQRQPWEPPIIPVSTKIVPKDFFEDLQFKEPNIFKFVTPKEHLLRSMGVESLVKDLTEAKKEAYLKGIDANNFIDNTIKDINRKAPKFEKIKKKVFNQPTERVANFRDLLDKYETAPDYLNDKDKEIFNKLRKFTNEMLSDVNVVRERLGLDPIKKLNAYVPHFLDELAKQIVQKKYPFPEDVKYWLGRNMPKKIYNPTEMERRVSKELTDVFSKDLGKLLKVMSRYDLRDIYLSQPYSILRAKLNALGDKIPASVRKEIDDYIRYDIFEYPDELDNLFNNLVKTPTELINFFLRPFGRIVTNPAKAVSGIMRRGLMGGAIAARPKLIIRNLFQRLLLMDLYQPKYFLKAQLMPTPKRIKDLIDNSKFWKLSTKQGFEDIPKEGFSIEEKALAPYGWSHKSNVSVSMKTGAYFAEEMVKLSENPNSRFYKYAEKFAKEKGVSLDKLLWNKDDILLEAEDAGAYAQWLYYATGMPQIYRGQIKRLAFSLQSWSLNYFFKHVPEMITRTFTGRTSRGKLLRPIDRLNAIKGLAIIAGITYGLKELGDYAYDKYLLPWGIALNANIVSPAGQVFGGIINYVTAYNDWERVKAEKQIKDAWKLFIPGSLAYKDFTDWLNGNKSLDESLFYKDYRRINEKELNKTTKTKRTGSKTTTTKKKRATK